MELDDEVTEDVLQKHNVEETNFPKIKLGDLALSGDAELDDVIKTTRNSRMTDEAVAYRLVIE